MNTKNTYIRDLVGRMSLEQKVGALLTLGFAGTIVRPHIYEDIVKYHCGGLRLTPGARLFGSYVDPKSGKSVMDVVDTKGYKKGVEPPRATAMEYRAVLRQLQELAKSRPLGLPLHFSFDQEGGTSADCSFDGIRIFPKPMGLRATGDPELAYRVARAVSRQSRAVGFNWVHSPVLDVNVDPRNPEIYTRAYSDRAEEVAEWAAASCRGYRDGGLIATGKHFPGRGDSAQDAHFAMPVIDVDKNTLLRRELLPYRELIRQGLLPSIMIAHSIFPAVDPDDVATVSKRVITGLLRDELGFDGVITTDSMTMGGIAVRYGVANACVKALEAGADLVLMKAESGLVGETVDAILAAVKDGRIPEPELDKKVARVLGLKYEYGLFYPEEEPETPEKVAKDPSVGELADLVARRSVLVVRDKAGLLPLSRSGSLLVVEQINKTPNHMGWHPAQLFENCLRYHHTAAYLETAYTYDADDQARIRAAVQNASTVVATNFYIRGKLTNTEFLGELIRKNPGKKFVVVTNTPYEMSIPEAAGTVLVTFSTGPQNLEATAGVLFGAVTPEGEWPVAYRLPEK